jgi:hypothetical protein
MLPIHSRDQQPKSILDTALRLLHRRRRAFVRRNRLRIIGGLFLFACWITLLWTHRQVGSSDSASAGAAFQQREAVNSSLRTLTHFAGSAVTSATSPAVAVAPALVAVSTGDAATLLASV